MTLLRILMICVVRFVATIAVTNGGIETVHEKIDGDIIAF